MYSRFYILYFMLICFSELLRDISNL